MTKMKMGKSSRRGRRAVSGIVSTVIMFAILFSVGTSYFIFEEQQYSSYQQSLIAATQKLQTNLKEDLVITPLLETDGDVGFQASNPSTLTINMTAVLVISKAGVLLKCDGVGFPAGAGCSNSTPTLWMAVEAGQTSSSIDTGYVYVSGTTDSIKVITARGNSFTATYPTAAQQTPSSQSVTVALDNLRWVQLIPEASALVQKNYVANCNAASCALAYNSHVTSGNILVDAVGWGGNAPPSSTPTDTLGDSFTLGASSSVVVPSSTALVQDKYTSNCNAASCGLAFSSNVASGHTLVYAVGWANNNPPSAPTDTRGDTFSLGSSQSVTINPVTPAVVQERYNANCNSATCSLAYNSAVTSGNTLVLGLGWPAAAPVSYVPVTVTNCAAPATAALEIDGSGTGDFSSTNSGTVSVTTAQANDIIVVLVNNEDEPNSAVRTVSSVTSTGLTFAEKGSPLELGSPTYQDTEVWWALDSTAGTDTITVTLSGSTDDASLVAFGVSGANTSSPWDTNGALPATATNAGGSAPTVSGVSTTNAKDIVLGFQGNAEGTATQSTTETAGSGMTLIQDVDNEGGTNSDDAGAEYEVVSSAQSSVSVGFGTSTYSANAWTMLANAIQAASSGCGTNPTLDGSAFNTGSGSTTLSATLSTANSNDVIIVITTTQDSAYRTVSSVTGTGLTFSQRGTQYEVHAGYYTVLSEWYAIASAPLSGESITATYSAAPGHYATLDVFGISGANTASPFDSNGALPSQTSETAASITTSNAKDFLIGFELGNSNAQSPTQGTGWSGISTSTDDYFGSEYQTVTTTQSALSVTWSNAASNAYAMLGDAVQAAPATPNPFQQMVTWDPATYSSYEATNLGNIRFCTTTTCGTELDAWLESCSSTCSSAGSTSTSASAWVKLTSSIALGGSLTIYMVFESTSTNFDDNYWGEAPQLSSTYAQYDNGANVFTFYDDFAGTSLSSKWTSSGSNTVTVNNGLSIAKSGTSNNNPAIYTSSYTQGAGAVDFYGTIPSGGGSGSYTYSSIGVMSSSNLNDNQAVVGDFNSAYGLQTGTSGAATNPVAGLTFGSAQTYSVLIPSSSPSSISAQDNYGSTITSSADMPTLPQPLGFEAQDNGVSLGPIDWIRDRAYPPSGVMPTTSFGSASGTVIAYVPITLTNSQSSATPNPFQQLVTWDPATYSTYEATNLGNVRFCADDACNSPLYSWLESCSSTCSSAGSTSTSATAWVKLNTAIAANGGQTTIYLVFEATSTNFDDNYWGEAPQLSGTYAQYDNGANVFAQYFNFAGTSLPSGWGDSGTVTISNGVTVGTTGQLYSNSMPSAVNPTTQVVDFYAYEDSTANGQYSYSDQDGLQTANGAGTGSSDQLFASTYNTGSPNAQQYWLYQYNGANYAYGADTDITPSTTYYVFSLWQSSTAGFLTLNYANQATSSSDFVSFTAAEMLFANQGANAALLMHWARVRALPPSGVMPATSVGSVVSGSIPTAVTDTLGSTFALVASNGVTSGTSSYYSYIYYGTAPSSGADTITATFSSSVPASISIYELTGYSTSGSMTSTGSSSAGSTSASVTSFTPSSNSIVIGNVETASSSTKYTVGTGYTSVATGSGGCDANDASEGCNEYETGVGSSTPVPFTLSASTPWVESAVSFAPTGSTTYYSYIYYATASSSGADTISASFSQTVAGSVSIYEISGVTATGLLTGTGSSSTSQSGSSVATITPTSSSLVIGNTEGGSTAYTAGTGYTLSGTCSTVGGCGEYQTAVTSGTTVPMSMSPSVPWVEAAVAFPAVTTTYYSYIWYATASTSGADTITTTFSSAAAASVSIYEITDYTATGLLSSTGSSAAGSTTPGVTSFTPASDSFIVGNTEAAASDSYTASSGFTNSGTCTTVLGCSEYDAGGGGSANTVPMTLGTSEPWVEAAISFSTPFNPQSGIQVGGYPTLGVPGGAVLAWEVTFTDVDPDHRSITIWPQSDMAIGATNGPPDADYNQEHYYIIDGLNPGSTTVNAYTSTTGGAFLTLQYNVPTTLFFAATAPLGSTTQTFGDNFLAPFEAYFALQGAMSDGTLFGETIPYPFGVITEANAYTSPTSGAVGAPVTVSCNSPCDFNDNYKAMVGIINSAGIITQLTTFTCTSSGNIPSGVSFDIPTEPQGYYTIEVTDYVNSVFMTLYITN